MRNNQRRSRRNKSRVDNLQLPITVRQAQKIVVKVKKLGSSYSFPGEIRQALSLSSCHDHDGALKKLANLASKDPNQVLIDANGKPPQSAENREEGESREKGTDEVAPTSDSPSEGSEMHGGDGNSGECDSPAETSSPEEREGDQGSQGNQAQLQAETADGGSQGQGIGDSTDSQETENSDRNAPQSNGSETGSSTSESCESGEKSQSPTDQKAESPESPNSGSGEDTATSPVREIDQKNCAAQADSDLRDDQVNQGSESPKKDAQPSVSAKAKDNVNSDRQAEKPGDDEAEGRTQKSHADNSENSLGENESDCVSPNDDTNAEAQASDDVPTHQKKWGKSFSKEERGEGKLSLSNSSNNGGATASLKVAGVSPKLLKLCRQRLAALVGDSSQQHSPRRDYTEFCVRLKTYRNPQPARKEEEGRPVILLLADVSGSCASFSNESVKVAKAASKLGVQGTDILVVSHYNGTPHEMEINGKVVDVRSIQPKAVKKTADNGCNWGNSSGWYETLMQRYSITVCIALGDWDGSLEYAYIAQHPQCEKFIWLDNAHCSSRGTVQDRTKFALDHYAQNFTGIKIPVLRQKLIYRDGCKDAIAFINNIKA
jgi:hypothetical protein